MQTITDNLSLLIIIGMFGAAMLVISFILINIRNRHKLLRQQKMAQEAALQHQKDLLYTTINSQEDERRRIGSDLHDEVGSALSTLRMYIQKYTEEQEDAPAKEFGTRCRSMIDTIISNTRNIAHDLSPLTSGAYGLFDALEDLCEKINLSGRPHIIFTSAGEDVFDKLKPPAALALYRVVQELVKNSITHADAGQITVEAKDDGAWLSLLYKDDGKGMDKNNVRSGMGLNNIESRLGLMGAIYQINTAPEKGFEVRIQIPLP